ncbi:MAG: trigger factor [Bacteroidetes bacterium]|nr:trigger factor [Bacteroidota bacterium]
MNVTREDINELSTLIKINLETTDYEPQVNSVIKDYSKKVQLKGFRQGKVPSSVIKKMYGTSILVEELNKLALDQLDKYLKDNEVPIIGQPLPKSDDLPDFDIMNPSAYEFVYELGLAPSIDVPKLLSSTPKVIKQTIEIKDKDIEEEIEKLQSRHGKMTNPDMVQEGDVLYVEFKELDSQGEVKEEGVSSITSLPLDIIKNKSLEKELIKMKKEDSVRIDIFKDIDREREQIEKHVLDLKEGAPEGMGSNFKMILKNINRVEKEEVGQVLFDKVFGENQVMAEQDFREKIQQEMQKYGEHHSESKLKRDLIDAMIEKSKIELPDEFLKRWIKVSNEKPISDEQIEEEYGNFSRNLKWTLIVNSIIKEKEIKIEKEELEAETRSGIANQFTSNGYPELDDEQLAKYSTQLMGDEEHIRKTFEQIADNKVLELLSTTFKFKSKEITYGDFFNQK